MGKLIDLTGEKFGRWTVLERADNQNKQIRWRCQCSCKKQTIKNVLGGSLKKGVSKSCGCLMAEDLTGQKFNRLFVLERVENKNKSVMWKCKCDCGKVATVSAGDLRHNKTKSCGCLKNEVAGKYRWKKIIGTTVGKLFVEELYEKRGRYYYYRCICSCDRERIVRRDKLQGDNPKIISCLICSRNKSYGERVIENFLFRNKIKHIQEYTFDDCRDQRPLPFDFYLSNYNLCIEFQGKQHNEPATFNGISKEKAIKKFKKQKKHDKIKKDYCRNNNINFLEIYYKEIKNIEDILIEKLNL